MGTGIKSILITGGTGSFGQSFIGHIFGKFEQLERVIIYSRDELKQYEMMQLFPKSKCPALEFILGDVRDVRAIRRALDGVEVVVHAAALKQVPTAEHNPFEFINTNIIGAQNLIEACLDTDVYKVIALSTDKAVAPANLYGATKLCSDRLFLSANNISTRKNISFSVVRYGNVNGSRGSVIPLFLRLKKSGILPITDKSMTRFSISSKAGIDMVLWAIQNAKGGEIFVPKSPSYRIVDLATAIDKSCQQDIIGVRPGEKIHEQMISPDDSANCIDIGDFYVIINQKLPSIIDFYCNINNGKFVQSGFCYSSGDNSDFLTVDQLRKIADEFSDA